MAQVLHEDPVPVRRQGRLLVAQARQPGDGVPPPPRQRRLPTSFPPVSGCSTRIFGEVCVAVLRVQRHQRLDVMGVEGMQPGAGQGEVLRTRSWL